MHLIQRKIRWSIVRGEYEVLDEIKEIDGVDHRKCESYGLASPHWAPLTMFNFHIKGRFSGFYHRTCNDCKPLQNERQRMLRLAGRAEYQRLLVAGLIQHDGPERPIMCSKCLHPTPHPRDFYQKDDWTWYKMCTHCIKHADRVVEQCMDELAHQVKQVKICKTCCQMKERAVFMVEMMGGFQARANCDVCRPHVSARNQAKRRRVFLRKNVEKNHTLDTIGCQSYTDEYDEDQPCPFGLDKNDIHFEDFVPELRDTIGLALTTAFDHHHFGEMNARASQIDNEYERNIEIHGHCDFRCKLCHELHHAMEHPAPQPNSAQHAIVLYKFQRIQTLGCGGPDAPPGPGVWFQRLLPDIKTYHFERENQKESPE